MKRRGIQTAAVFIGMMSLASPATAKPQTIKLISAEVNHHDTKTTSVAHDSDSIGPRVIGHDTVTCTFTGKNSARCRVIFVRPSFGTLYLSFKTSGNGSGHGTITGGTRAYSGAHGTFTYRSLNKAGSRNAVTLNLA